MHQWTNTQIHINEQTNKNIILLCINVDQQDLAGKENNITLMPDPLKTF